MADYGTLEVFHCLWERRWS